MPPGLADVLKRGGGSVFTIDGPGIPVRAKCLYCGAELHLNL